MFTLCKWKVGIQKQENIHVPGWHNNHLKLAIHSMQHQPCVGLFICRSQRIDINCPIWPQVLPRTLQQLQFLFPFVHVNTINWSRNSPDRLYCQSMTDNFPVIWKSTSRPTISRLIDRVVLLRRVLTFDRLFPILVKYNIYLLILWSCFQYCINVCGSQMSKGRCIVRFSQSYHKCLSIDDKARWCFMKFNSFRAVYACSNHIYQNWLVPSAECTSHFFNWQRRGRRRWCFNNDGKSTDRPASYEVIRRWRTFCLPSARFLVFVLGIFSNVIKSGKCWCINPCIMLWN